MAVKDKSKNPPNPVDAILDNPIVAKKPATPAQKIAVQSVAAQTVTPRTPDANTQRFLNRLQNGTMSVPADGEGEIAKDFLAWQRLFLFNDNKDSLVSKLFKAEAEPLVGPPLDLKNPIDAAYVRFHTANPDDRKTTATYERYISSVPAGSPHYRPQFHVSNDGFKAPAFTLAPAVAREQLAGDIGKVSKMYAADAGMSEKDFARVMGGIATIESRFGVARSVSGTKYASSAGGAFHYLDATIAGKVRQSLDDDPRISARVASLGVNVSDGVSKGEAWTLKEDNVLAGSILARDIVRMAKARPDLRNDATALATEVYKAHNMGEAGAAALARGGVDALNAVDSRIIANNPMFFRKGDAQQNYASFVGNAVHAADDLFAKLDKKPTTVLAAGYRAPEPS